MSHQARKEAEAAAQNLLKVDAARVRKAAAAQSRKVAATPMGKAQGRARVPLALEQRSSSWATRVPEQRSSGCGAATPPRSFTDGDCFLNGDARAFFDSAGQSPVTQPWDSQSSDPATWGNNATPHGGFTNFMQQPNMSHHFNLGGESSQFAPFRAPRTMQDFHSEEEFSTPITARNNKAINVDNNDEAPRSEKRIFWSQEEDVKMMSFWLLNSTDSSCGAD
ncbi:unnamed protein product, partial [Urochloa humidicola]